jgi:nitroimidazol reductase NimA-like FMN-containing flavoprotein (pyridoxamine 5'-phosphate oxidase superfamily)
MVSFDGAWSRAEAEAFLDAAVVPIRLGCHRPAGGLWMLSLWYRYRDGAFQCATSMSADVVQFLRQNEEVCFEVSTNMSPYMGVRGAGTATVEAEASKEVLRALIDRYLGTTEAKMAQWLLRQDREEATITIEPTRLYSWDFSKRMSGLDADAPAKGAEPSSPKYDE